MYLTSRYYIKFLKKRFFSKTTDVSVQEAMITCLKVNNIAKYIISKKIQVVGVDKEVVIQTES